MTANIEQVASAHRAAYRETDARPIEWDRHVEHCGACGTLDADAARAHRFVNAYMVANPAVTVEDIGDVLAYFEADITTERRYEPDGEFWSAIADYFRRRIEATR